MVVRGEVKAVLYNASDKMVKICKGIKFVQGIVMQNYDYEVKEGAVNENTEWGGSDGVDRWENRGN